MKKQLRPLKTATDTEPKSNVDDLAQRTNENMGKERLTVPHSFHEAPFLKERGAGTSELTPTLRFSPSLIREGASR